MKKRKWVLFIVLFVFLFFAGAIIIMNQNELKTAKNFEFTEIDMESVEDGTYYGEAQTNLVYVKVKVTVSEHRLQEVEILEHKKGLGGKAETIVNEMLEKNTFEVNAVSGATISSQTIKYAVCKALTQGIK